MVDIDDLVVDNKLYSYIIMSTSEVKNSVSFIFFLYLLSKLCYQNFSANVIVYV